MGAGLDLSSSDSEVHTLAIIVTSMAILSSMSILAMIIAFVSFKEFRTHPTTLIILPGPANLAAIAGVLISAWRLSNPTGLACQVQGFMLQWLLPSDAYWSLVASIDAILILERKITAEQFKNLYWLYGLLCYSLPLIPATLFIVHPGTSKIYDSAGSGWCWIGNEHATFWIYSMFLPVWVSIFVSVGNYIYVGIRVFKVRSELRELGFNTHHTGPGQAPTTDLNCSAVLTQYPEPVHSSSLESPRSPFPVGSAYNDDQSLIHGNRSKFRQMITHTGDFLSLSAFIDRLNHMDLDEVKYRYTRTAILLIMSTLVTWVPLTAVCNYQIVHATAKHPPYALGILNATVLPLQGFWHAIIFFSNSAPLCRTVWKDIRDGRKMKWTGKLFRQAKVTVNIPLANRSSRLYEGL